MIYGRSCDNRTLYDNHWFLPDVSVTDSDRCYPGIPAVNVNAQSLTAQGKDISTD